MTASPRVEAKTVLVADDTAFVRDRFKAAIEGAGHKALTAQTGPELLGRVRTDVTDLDLIVLDLRLPQGNGVALLRAIRKIAQDAPPVMVFSGTIASADEVRELGALGVTGYVNEYMAVQHIVPALVPHLFPDRSNRRSSPRVVLGIPVAYRFGNTIAAALTLNISRGGLAVRTTSPLAVGTAVKVRFRLPGSKRDIDTESQIAWTDRRVGMGLQFTGASAADQAQIDDYIQGHFFSNRKA
jgi:two-component system, chemotaxis family, chemotaxis protein CheY